MHEAERLLTAGNVQITSVDPEHPDAQYCLQEYVAELNRRSQRGFDPSVGATALPREVRPPAGEFFVAYLHGEAVGCGAVKHHADAPAEIKRMWIAPRARGLGLGRRLLERLETCARTGRWSSGGAHRDERGPCRGALAVRLDRLGRGARVQRRAVRGPLAREGTNLRESFTPVSSGRCVLTALPRRT